MISFTVITCTYNAQSVIERTLDSVLNQSYPYVEHLIIDGASTDDTMALVRKYENENIVRRTSHQVSVVSEKDKGFYFAMNKGLDLATGVYIVFLNAGDVFPSSDTLQMVAHKMDGWKTLPGIIYGDTDIVDDAGHFLRHRRLAPPENLSWRSFKWGMLVCHQSFYALQSITSKIHYDTNYKYSADVDWCIRVMKAAEEEQRLLMNAHAVLTNYLDGGMSVQNHRDSLRERFGVMKRHYGL